MASTTSWDIVRGQGCNEKTETLIRQVGSTTSYTLDVIFMAIVIVVGGNNVRGKYGPFSKKDHNKDGHKNSN